jgi:diguanylate cyclase (GGDEF)-like protein
MPATAGIQGRQGVPRETIGRSRMRAAHNVQAMTVGLRDFGWCWRIQLLAALPLLLWASLALAQVALDPWRWRLEDDPRAAEAQARASLARETDPYGRFWLQIARVRAFSLLEDPARAAEALASAKAELARLGSRADGVPLTAWLELDTLWIDALRADPAPLLDRVRMLSDDAKRGGDTALQCEVFGLVAWSQVAWGSLDDGWRAAEAQERCAQARGDGVQVAAALGAMARATEAGAGDAGRHARATELLRRARAALGEPAPRMRRSLIEWDLARIHQSAGDFDQAARHLTDVIALSRSLSDEPGVASGLIELASVRVPQGRAAEALAMLDEADRLLGGRPLPARRVRWAETRILALAALGRPEVLGAIDDLQRDIAGGQLPPIDARLARAIATGQASQQRWAEAFEALQQATTLERTERLQTRDETLQTLERRYELAHRHAEAAELRLQRENAELMLRAERARQRMLWAALILLAVLATVALTTIGKVAQRRRRLADLALRDELTGSPNRRAVSAYGEAQFANARRLALPLTLAIVDLDRFKSVNDQFGHAAGDAVLEAFAAACAEVLRGQDRFGRWGGEEWLLVMPGTPLSEMPRVFERLRAAFNHQVVAGVGQPHGLTFSMGAAEVDDRTVSFESLIREADARLYGAKAAGRDQLAAA